MGKGIGVLAMVALFLAGNPAWAELDQELLRKYEQMSLQELVEEAARYPDEKKIPEELSRALDNKEEAEQEGTEEQESRCATYKQDLSKGAREGRFQACPVAREAVFIIDTKEGHMWLLQATDFGQAEEIYLIYEGRVCPVGKMGDVIERAAPGVATNK
jgi:hypothetical protein